jgi:hypothetical protein
MASGAMCQDYRYGTNQSQHITLLESPLPFVSLQNRCLRPTEARTNLTEPLAPTGPPSLCMDCTVLINPYRAANVLVLRI